MKYICLLRGINISGKNKISMSELKEELEGHNYNKVITYLNSGNIIFNSKENNKAIITEDIHNIIYKKFNLDIPVFIMDDLELEDVLSHCPLWWGTSNKEIYDNLIFIMPPTTYKKIYNEIGSPSENIEKIEEYKNYIFWSFNLKEYRKSNWWIKTASVDVKDRITIRTANTMRKVLEICKI